MVTFRVMGHNHTLYYLYTYAICTFNTLPHMAILGSFNLAANKDMMSKIWTNGDTII